MNFGSFPVQVVSPSTLIKTGRKANSVRSVTRMMGIWGNMIPMGEQGPGLHPLL
jgi:hypothetical protein